MNFFLASSRLLRSAPVLVKSIPSVRGAIYLDRDWMPGDYPKTEEERLAAAKKYNLLPEEYEPYDPEKWEMAVGDYPMLPNLHRADHDSDRSWDYQSHHHNYGDPWHAQQERYMWYLPEMNLGEDFVPPKELFIFWSMLLGVAYAYCCFIWKYDRILVFKPLHTPFTGQVHYHYPSSKLEVYDEHHHHH